VIASPWRRWVASFVDGLILVPVTLLLMALAGVDWVNTTPLQNFLFNWVPSWAYYVAFTALYGATPGKMLLGIRVVKTDGRPVDWLTALGGGQNPVRLALGPRLPVGLLPSPKAGLARPHRRYLGGPPRIPGVTSSPRINPGASLLGCAQEVTLALRFVDSVPSQVERPDHGPCHTATTPLDGRYLESPLVDVQGPVDIRLRLPAAGASVEPPVLPVGGQSLPASVAGEGGLPLPRRP